MHVTLALRDVMSATDISMKIPDGFTQHTRTSPITEP